MRRAWWRASAAVTVPSANATSLSSSSPALAASWPSTPSALAAAAALALAVVVLSLAVGRDDYAKIFAAEKLVKCRAICMALDVSPRNSSAAVPAVQSDPKTKRGNSHRRRRQGRRERRQGQKSSPPIKIVIYRTIRMGLGPDASNARIVVPTVQSDLRSKRGAPNQRQRRGGNKTKNRRHRENREIFYDSHGSWYWHRQLECRGFSRAVRSKFQERRLAGTETPPKVPRSHFNWRTPLRS